MTAIHAAIFGLRNPIQLLNSTGDNKTPVWFKKTSFTDSHQTFFCNLGVSGTGIGNACPRSLGIISWTDLTLVKEVMVNYLTNNGTRWRGQA